VSAVSKAPPDKMSPVLNRQPDPNLLDALSWAWRNVSVRLVRATESDYTGLRWEMLDRSLPHSQLWLITGGAATLAVGLDQITVSAGTGIYIPPHISHRGSADPSQPFRCFALHHTVSVFGASMPERLLPLSLRPRTSTWQRMLTAAREIRRESEQRDTCFEVLADAAMSRLLGLYWREATHRPEEGTASTAAGPRGQPRIARVLAHIASNVHRKITLGELATLVRLNPAHFSTVFRQATGFTVVEYINRYRVQRAKELLEFTSDSVVDVAAAVGFSDPYYFSRIFRRFEGLPPGRYRSQHHQAEMPPHPPPVVPPPR
jgi:AraC-like DNA-binding protein